MSIKESYIRLKDNKSIILDDYNDGMSLSVHIPGGHITIFLDKNEALEVLNAVQAIMEDENAKS